VADVIGARRVDVRHVPGGWWPSRLESIPRAWHPDRGHWNDEIRKSAASNPGGRWRGLTMMCSTVRRHPTATKRLPLSQSRLSANIH